MTGEDAEVICGEWEIGQYSQEESVEDYNVVFNIERITIHPDYNISRGVGKTQFVVADIATIHVQNVEESVFSSRDIFPACLPTGRTYNGSYGIHSGWSSPPSLEYINEYADLFLPYYRDFSKQWHYNMQIIQCLDPIVNEVNGQELDFPTNTYYPPGILCATENSKLFCPSSGESGSPLMMSDGTRYVAEYSVLSKVVLCSTSERTPEAQEVSYGNSQAIHQCIQSSGVTFLG